MARSVVQIEINTMNKVLELLGSMPYNQVAGLVEEIKSSSEVVSLEEAETETEE